jgi:hypothetical protein
MITFILFFTFVVGSIFGFSTHKFFLNKNEEEIKRNKIEEINEIFTELHRSMLSGKVKYKNRMNQACYLLSELDEYGVVEIVYMIDKKEIGIFKEGKCIYTSDLVDKEIVGNISNFIESVFKREISDVINVFGLVLSKSEFEKTFKIKYEDFEKFRESLFSSNFNSDIDLNITDVKKNKKEAEIKYFDVDEILDKISTHGLSSLTDEERLFLDNYSNEKGN